MIGAAGLRADSFPAGDDPRALPFAEPDVSEHGLELALVDHGAQLRRGIQRLTRRQLATQRRDPLDELLADRPMDDEARPRVTGLPAVVEDAPADRRRGRLEVADIGEDELRTLATELERDRLDVRLADGAEQRACPPRWSP